MGLLAQTDGSVVRSSVWTVLLDILIVALILYGLYTLIQQTRALRILYGIAVLGMLYLISKLLSLTALNFLLQSAFTVTLVAIPVVFQQELRAFLERLGRGDFLRSLVLTKAAQTKGISSELASAVRELARARVGALIALERKDRLKELAASGISLDATVTVELIVSLFQPETPLHDGAIIIRGDRIAAASVFLPLSSESLDPSLGTRHRAALGLSSETDAVVIVVSEETGRISIAHHQELDVVASRALEGRLRLLLSAEGRPR